MLAVLMTKKMSCILKRKMRGRGLQFLQEIRDTGDIQVLITSQKEAQFTPLSNFLSHPFGPHDLLPKSTPLLLEPHHNALSISLPNNDNNATMKLRVAELEAAGFEG
ncbi:hypothetical protein RJT34_12824 [Clitoria ternatea]|uniref:Uncharacterized protein n=1 Tax=Clitoria ternatea TaxID=43366 RepID=A0AAN9JMT0_CLITE